jgi:hypothetical protein
MIHLKQKGNKNYVDGIVIIIPSNPEESDFVKYNNQIILCNQRDKDRFKTIKSALFVKIVLTAPISLNIGDQ